MSEHTVEPPVPFARGASVAALRGWAYRYRWLLGVVGLLIAGALVVRWAGTRPGYDPYGWLVWGHLTWHGALNTDGAPSWKPLPYLFTLPYALAGAHAVSLWMVTAVAGSLAGVVFAWRVAFALVDAPPERRYAAYVAGLFAAGLLFGIDTILHSALSAQSDTLIVAATLAAVDCIIHRRYRWAFWMWWLGALGRPEVWPPFALYVAWAWLNVPAMRRQMVAGVALVPLLWFGIPGLTSKSPFSAASLAERSPRELHGNKIVGTFDRFSALNPTAVKLAALVAALLGLLRRDRAVLLLAGGVVLWVAVEMAFALHGWPAVPRYVFPAAAGVCVLAGVFAGRVILDAPAAFGRLAAWAHLPRFPVAAAAGWAAAIVLLVFVVALHGPARSRYIAARADLHAQRARTHSIALLSAAISRLGADRIQACGLPEIPIGYQSILALKLGRDTGGLYWDPRHERLHPRPAEMIYPHSYGWQFFPAHQTSAAARARCRGLSATARF